MGLSYQLSAISFAKQICGAASEKQVPFDFAQGQALDCERSFAWRTIFLRSE